MKRLVLFASIFMATATLKAETTKMIQNPFTGRPDYITSLSTVTAYSMTITSVTLNEPVAIGRTAAAFPLTFPYGNPLSIFNNGFTIFQQSSPGLTFADQLRIGVSTMPYADSGGLLAYFTGLSFSPPAGGAGSMAWYVDGTTVMSFTAIGGAQFNTKAVFSSSVSVQGPILDKTNSAGTSGQFYVSGGSNTASSWRSPSFTTTYKAAVCQGPNTSLGFSGFAVSTPTAACVTGTNSTFGTAQFVDTSTMAVQDHWTLPTDWTGAVDTNIVWRSTQTSGNTVWQIRTACIADGETVDAAFNAPSTVTDAAKGSTNQLNTASMSNITMTGCAAGEEFFFEFYRNPALAGDTLNATAELLSLQFVYRRNITQ